MASSNKIQDDFLTCSICMEVYQQPVTLTCQPSFCKNCLKKYIHTRLEAVTNKTIPCPTCRQETPVPYPHRPVEEWAGQLKPGLLLTGLMDSVVDDTKCCSMCLDEGKTTPASTWCTDCQTCFCDDCIKLHNKVPTTRNHDVSKLTGDNTQKLKKKYMCKEHGKKVKLFCRDCSRSLCTLCCSISHRKCEDVITIKDMIPEVTGQLMKRQKNLDKIANQSRREAAKYGDEVDKAVMESASVKSDITKTVQATVDHLHEKVNQLLNNIDVQINQQTEKLRSEVKRKQSEAQMYQQQSQFIQQALELEDEAQLFEMYLSSGSEAVANIQFEDLGRTHRKSRAVDHGFVMQELERLKEEITKIVVSLRNTIDLTAAPVLHEVLDVKLERNHCCDVRDVVVMNISDTKITVFADCVTQRLKSIYQKNGQCTSVINVPGYPWCITVISEGTVAVSLPDSQRIIKVAVTQGLEILSTIQTIKKYKGLSSLDQSKMVAGSDSPSSVDLINMQGNVLKTFTTLNQIGISFINPRYIHVTQDGNILVSDCGLKGIICLKRSGEIVFSFTSTLDKELMHPYGVTSTRKGDILVADWDTNKVVHFSRSGKYIGDILTANNGLKDPFGLFVDENTICVSLAAKGVHKYRFV